ncbi:periplasmic nitrate reductase, NapE protein [Cellvibrio sp. NN19]|uniref:periplasmic nitrate reductase, NapE protein n=1 Tax=Cellvibrio chitinivorans TaxID=3102792 RepID=UPI002B4007B6|nr:periplasmic nitrate reductase, NapE protein [Cellvibrio sp. NN19]
MQDNHHQPGSLTSNLAADAHSEKKKEWRLFIFIIVFLFPILTVALVATMGFSIWFYQLIMGPPGPY